MKSSTPMVSVMMPVLAPQPVYFREAVSSLLSQTLTDIELIIVEDPSETSAEQVIAELADPRIRYFRNPKRTSLVDQRNQALSEARAEFVACLDADDVALPERLQKQLEYMTDRGNVDVLGSQLLIIDAGGADIGYRAYPTSHEAIVKAMCEYNAIAQPSVMCRRRVMIECGGYQYRTYPVNEDYELWSRLVLRGARFANHPEPLLRYRIHAEGTKATMMRRMLHATIDVKKQFWVNRMTTRGRLRYWGEHVLLVLPSSWIFRLFALTQYQSVPASPKAEVGHEER